MGLVTVMPRTGGADIEGKGLPLCWGVTLLVLLGRAWLSGPAMPSGPPPKNLAPLAKQRLISVFFQCYKSSKDHSPQLDVNLLGSSVVHKEKQVRKKEHKLKITPMNADVIVLGLQSKDQAEQWLRVRKPPGR